MSVCLWVGLLPWRNQRWVCVSSGVLVRFAPRDQGVRGLFPFVSLSILCCIFRLGLAPSTV